MLCALGVLGVCAVCVCAGCVRAVCSVFRLAESASFALQRIALLLNLCTRRPPSPQTHPAPPRSDAASLGTSPAAQLVGAARNLTTVVTRYEAAVAAAPSCVGNSSWLRALNASVNGILRNPDGERVRGAVR